MISVCIATYNGEKYIVELLNSVLAQIGDEDEIVISDDGSSDNTLDIINALNDSRLRIVFNKGSRSPLNNFENAILHSRGDFIFLADQDDVWLSDKVTSMLSSLLDNDLVISDCMVVNENLECMHESFFKFNKSSPGVVKNIFKNSYLGCCMAFKRSMLPYILPFPRFIPMHDWWIGLVLDSVGRVSFIDNKLILFRRHGENASMTASISPYSIKQKFVWRVCIAFSLILRLLRVL